MSLSSTKLERLGGGALFEALREAADRSRLGLALVFLDADPPELHSLNQYCFELLGYSAAELAQLGPYDLVAPQELPTFRQQTRRQAGQPRLTSFETTLVTKAGRRLPVEVTLSDIELDGSSATVAFLRDASERWRAMSALQESEERFRLVVEGAPDGVAILNGVNIRFLNPRAARMLGVESSEAGKGRAITDFLHPDDVPLAAERIRNLLQTGETHREPAEYRSRSIDGQELFVEISAIPIEIGGERAVLAFARDVTERKAIQNRLAEAERLTALGVLSAGVAHEINNPLAYVLLNLEYLRRELPNVVAHPERISDLLVRVHDAFHGAERVATIVRDLRTFARGDDSVRGPVDLIEVVEAALNIASSTLNHRARLTREYAGSPTVEGNPNRLEQVFLNLLLNAAQAIPEGDAEHNEIRVSLRTEGEQVVAEISDTGAGIPPALLTRIFEPFFTTKPVGVGTGLGLPICRSIVATHGGTLDVESQLGRGTTFRAVFPTSKLPRQASRKPSSRAPANDAPRGNVLIVDDEGAVGSTLRLVLQGEHNVHVATSAQDALELMAKQRFDAVICDLMMPGMSGVDLYDVVKAAFPGMEHRIVFMTGGTLMPQSEALLSKLSRPLLEKPFDIALVRQTLRTLVALRG